jgi:2-succinyl-6-hydroxy-2,4-cyclohexadiene-1-carboxylate synthase
MSVVVHLGEVDYNIVGTGAGPALTLLHGFTGSSVSWANLHETIGSRFRLIMPDLLGHGRSAAPADPALYRMERAVVDLMAILDAMDAARTHLLGYSMGGRVALAAAIAHPERFTSLILESASPGIADAGAREARIASDEALAEMVEHKGLETFVNRWERLPIFSGQERLPGAVRAGLRAQRLTNNPRGLAGSLRGLGAGVQAPLWERLGELRMPTLIMAGELDVKYVEIAQRMAEAIVNSRLVVIPDATHTIHLEQPEVFQRLMLEFVGGIEQ